MQAWVRWCTAATIAGLALATPAAADVPAVSVGPAGTSQQQDWQVGTPACTITQAWRKRPDLLNVRAIAFTGAVRCSSVPANLSVGGWIQVFDEADPAGSAVVDSTGGMGPSATPESFSITPVLRAPKPGHVYEYEFRVSFVELSNPYVVDGVDNPPPQCRVFGHTNDPSGTGPGNWQQPEMDCLFAQQIVVP